MTEEKRTCEICDAMQNLCKEFAPTDDGKKECELLKNKLDGGEISIDDFFDFISERVGEKRFIELLTSSVSGE